MPLQIVRNDITKVKADIIVNTANPKPIFASGTDSAIYKAAGEKELLAERKKIGDIKRGDIAVTPAFGLDAKYIIHTVGPVWVNGNSGEFDILASCYRKSLEKAEELKCKSIAFPLIATGVYGFPKSEALNIAMHEISDFLTKTDYELEVYLVVFDPKSFRLSSNLFFKIESFIDDEAVKKAHKEEYNLTSDEYETMVLSGKRELEEIERYNQNFKYEEIDGEAKSSQKMPPLSSFKKDITKPISYDTINRNDYKKTKADEYPFKNQLFKLMNEKNIDAKSLYEASNMSKSAFYKIYNNDTKVPSKSAVFGLCIGLKLSLEEAEEFMATGDYAFNPKNKKDELIKMCLRTHQYDIVTVNIMLFVCGLDCIGAVEEDLMKQYL